MRQLAPAGVTDIAGVGRRSVFMAGSAGGGGALALATAAGATTAAPPPPPPPRHCLPSTLPSAPAPPPCRTRRGVWRRRALVGLHQAAAAAAGETGVNGRRAMAAGGAFRLQRRRLPYPWTVAAEATQRRQRPGGTMRAALRATRPVSARRRVAGRAQQAAPTDHPHHRRVMRHVGRRSGRAPSALRQPQRPFSS